ncbi:MAG: hypothetical protein M9895_04410 [Aquamicrobium sp.]|uniref:hypothetical protein n=1 Tax=Aquamicrobium sp. TaxID=1872579 RepID=UPI00349E5B62|nr:hypothetical protein [Aquamicrobium sp.]MCO5157953.1 hypothetical protein [Aquamicrobium sp.]
MAIVIKKKASTKAPARVVEPDELVAPRSIEPAVPERPVSWRDLPIASSIEELWAAKSNTMRPPDPTSCDLCGHSYAFPCHGKAENCMNAKWARETGKQVP